MLQDFVLGSFKLNSEGSASSASYTRRINFAAMALGQASRHAWLPATAIPRLGRFCFYFAARASEALATD
jgi:hypothetical protein